MAKKKSPNQQIAKAKKRLVRAKHTCFDQADKLLAANNTRFTRDICFNQSENSLTMVPKFATEKIEPRKPGRAKTVTFSYCPICGRKL